MTLVTLFPVTRARLVHNLKRTKTWILDHLETGRFFCDIGTVKLRKPAGSQPVLFLIFSLASPSFPILSLRICMSGDIQETILDDGCQKFQISKDGQSLGLLHDSSVI